MRSPGKSIAPHSDEVAQRRLQATQNALTSMRIRKRVMCGSLSQLLGRFPLRPAVDRPDSSLLVNGKHMLVLNADSLELD